MGLKFLKAGMQYSILDHLSLKNLRFWDLHRHIQDNQQKLKNTSRRLHIRKGLKTKTEKMRQKHLVRVPS
jgi:hypothetical protein